MKHRFLIILFAMAFSASSWAAGRPFTFLKEKDWLVQLGGDLQITGSKANQIEGATFSQEFTYSQIFHLGLSVKFWGNLFLGFQYAYWSATQNFITSTEESISDTFTFHGLEPQLGLEWGNPRIQYRLILGAQYPLSFSIARDKTEPLTFIPDEQLLSYELRFQLNLKFSSSVAWILEGGYRLMDFGILSAGSESYINTGDPAGDRLDLSGPFVGSAIGIYF
jgi:hypothetical protein